MKSTYLKITILETPHEEQLWEKFVANFSQSMPYHRLSWRNLLIGEYGFRPYYLLAVKDDRAVGVLPLFYLHNLTGRKMISLPMSQYGSILSRDREATIALVKKAVQLTNQLSCHYLLLKNDTAFAPDILSKLATKEQPDYLTCRLDLRIGLEQIKAGVSRNKWRSVTACGEAGMKTRLLSKVEDIDSLYQLELRLRQRQGSPIPSMGFFRQLWQKLGSTGELKGILVEKGNTIIAGELFFALNKRMVNIYSISNDQYRQFSPITLAHWKEIEWGCANNYDFLDFGATPKAYSGILEFKLKWGCKAYESPYYYYPQAPKIDSTDRHSPIYQLLSFFWKRIPLGLSARVGSPFIRCFA